MVVMRLITISFQFLIKGYTRIDAYYAEIQPPFNSSLKDTKYASNILSTPRGNFQFLIKGYNIPQVITGKCLLESFNSSLKDTKSLVS